MSLRFSGRFDTGVGSMSGRAAGDGGGRQSLTIGTIMAPIEYLLRRWSAVVLWTEGRGRTVGGLLR